MTGGSASAQFDYVAFEVVPGPACPAPTTTTTAPTTTTTAPTTTTTAPTTTTTAPITTTTAPTTTTTAPTTTTTAPCVAAPRSRHLFQPGHLHVGLAGQLARVLVVGFVQPTGGLGHRRHGPRPQRLRPRRLDERVLDRQPGHPPELEPRQVPGRHLLNGGRGGCGGPRR